MGQFPWPISRFPHSLLIPGATAVVLPPAPPTTRFTVLPSFRSAASEIARISEIPSGMLVANYQIQQPGISEPPRLPSFPVLPSSCLTLDFPFSSPGSFGLSPFSAFTSSSPVSIPLRPFPSHEDLPMVTVSGASVCCPHHGHLRGLSTPPEAVQLQGSGLDILSLGRLWRHSEGRLVFKVKKATVPD